ncbi:uncharacterized protein LOC133195333 [Saccostrea echinata]|uniref:uncharacterized protein LOC133195333 n=1 Tax=Saccostrea echinata TaxID=191078 RepID=UPI002A7F9537|nr:uncharacterized protein LOC133195333 [Saccostrea echinata]
MDEHNAMSMDLDFLELPQNFEWDSFIDDQTLSQIGQPYPPKSLYMLCVGILRYFRECGIHENFLDEKDSKFYEFRRILSARMSELTVSGVGTRPKQAEPISTETETELWEKRLLGDVTGKALLNTMFFYNCKLFGLRGVDEHRGMEIDLIELGFDKYGHFLKFKGRSNKTFKGGLAQRHVQAKEIVHHFQNMKLYNMHQKYIEIITKCGESRAFYRRALENGPDNELRFSQQAIGVNKLAAIMKTMFLEAGIPGYFTNHSGKRTLATTLYQAGVPEQEMMERTGHRSVESVRKYKRPSTDMLKDISNLLEPQQSEQMDIVNQEPPQKVI